jgi:TetR/AcrR family transcriptional regulator, tetracycline repressor protein
MPRIVNPRRRLSAETVVEVALRVADEGGLEALSLRRLASVLGVTPMAIYRHVRDKDHLLDLMADRLLQQMELPPADTEPWAEALRRMGHRLLSVIEAHPAAPFLLARPFTSPSADRIASMMLAVLDRAGFDRADAMRLLQVLTGMILGPAIHRATYRAAWRADASDGYPERRRADHAPAENAPHLAAAADQLADWSSGPEADRITVELWVGGVEALASRRRSDGASRRS